MSRFDLDDMLAETNHVRQVRGLPALIRHKGLSKSAQFKADDMASNGYYAHVSPDGVEPVDLINRFTTFAYCGENIARRSSRFGRHFVLGWMRSPGHAAQILKEDFTRIGLGLSKGTHEGKTCWYGVQHFAD